KGGAVAERRARRLVDRRQGPVPRWDAREAQPVARSVGEERHMFDRGLAVAIAALAASLAVSLAQAHDATKYPDLRGQWGRGKGGAQWDQSKPGGLRQEVPLTPEYQAIYEANLRAEFSGGEAYNPQAVCMPSGMPRMMIAYEPLEVIVTAEVTY